MDFLKSKTVVIKSIGDKALTIKELSLKAQAEFSDVVNDDKRRYLAGAVTCKYGVVEWADKSVDELAEMLSMVQIGEISAAIHELGGIVKNSESDLTDSSSLN